MGLHVSEIWNIDLNIDKTNKQMMKNSHDFFPPMEMWNADLLAASSDEDHYAMPRHGPGMGDRKLPNLRFIDCPLALIFHFRHLSFLLMFKLMRLDRGWPEIWSKSYSNWLLINFFDPNLPRSIVATILIRNLRF